MLALETAFQSIKYHKFIDETQFFSYVVLSINQSTNVSEISGIIFPFDHYFLKCIFELIYS